MYDRVIGKTQSLSRIVRIIHHTKYRTVETDLAAINNPLISYIRQWASIRSPESFNGSIETCICIYSLKLTNFNVKRRLEVYSIERERERDRERER